MTHKVEAEATRQIGYLRFTGGDNGFAVDEHLCGLRNFFLEFCKMEGMRLSLYYYFPGNFRQQVQLFVKASACGEYPCQPDEFLAYTGRFIDTIHLDRENDASSLLAEAKQKLPCRERIIMYNQKGMLLYPNMSLKPLKLFEMTERIFGCSTPLLLSVHLEPLPRSQAQELLPALYAQGAISNLDGSDEQQLPVLLDWINLHPDLDDQLKDLKNSLLSYRFEVQTEDGLDERIFAILRQGLGGEALYQYLDHDKMYEAGTDEDDSLPLFESLVHAGNAPLLFQFPLANYYCSHIQVEDPPLLQPHLALATKGIRLGRVDFFGEDRDLCISEQDLSRHAYILGKTGSGKSTMLLTMIVSAIEQGNQAVFVMDPHGDLSTDILQTIDAKTADRVVYIDFGNTEWFPGINVLEANDDSEREFCIGEMDNYFQQMYGEYFGPRLQDVFRNLSYILSCDPAGPGLLLDLLWAINLDDSDIRNHLEKIARNTGLLTLKIFLDQITKKTFGDGSLSEIMAYYRSKFSPLVDNLYLRNILGQPKSTIDIASLAAEKKVCLFNLSKGKLSSRYSGLIGSILTMKIFHAAISSTAQPFEERSPMLLVLDEFQNFVSPTVEDILCEARKYRLSLVLANQYLGQLAGKGVSQKPGYSLNMLEGILGNVGTFCSFRLSADDAEQIASEFGHAVTPAQISSLPNWHSVCKVSRDGCTLPPFTLRTTLTSKRRNSKTVEKIIKSSKEKYCRPRKQVEKEINNRLKQRLGLYEVPENSMEGFI